MLHVFQKLSISKDSFPIYGSAMNMVSLADIEEMGICTKTSKRDSNKAIGPSGTVFATPDLILILKQ